MIEVLMLIPKADNDGNIFSAEHDRAFESVVLSAFGGLTWMGTAEGVWAQDNRIYRDSMRTMKVAMLSIKDGGKLGDLAAFAKTHYQQEAIYISYLGLAEIL